MKDSIPTLATPPPLSAETSSFGDAVRTLGHVMPWLLWAFKEAVKWPFYRLYRARLQAKAGSWCKPRHLGIVMDGNRRFARQSGFARVLHGHARGADKLHEVLGWCLEHDVPVVTVWCFSIENFQRSAEEVEDLLGLFEDKARAMADDEELHRRRVRVRFIGRLDMLPESLREEIRRVEEATAGYDRNTLNIAMAYGGREEIADAFRDHVRQRLADGGAIDQILDQLDVSHIGSCLYTSGQPEPDLILRTSGELRMSGFLLWQSAYSELYFCDTNWPAFRDIDFLRALRDFDARQRRFGR